MDEVVIFAVVVSAFTIGFLAWMFFAGRKPRTHTKEEAPAYQELQATVIDLCCAVRTIGYKTPKTVTLFAVTFETAEGQRLQLQVPEEMYEGLEKGQTGLLTLVDGELYSFVLSEI